MAEIEYRQQHTTNLLTTTHHHIDEDLGKGMDKIDGEITFKAKDSENKRAEDCKLKLCGCGFLIKDDSEEEDFDDFDEVVDDYESFPYDLDKAFERDLLEAKKEKEAYLKAKKESEANGGAEPKVHLFWWRQRNRHGW